jgi:hypothetical protein
MVPSALCGVTYALSKPSKDINDKDMDWYTNKWLTVEFRAPNDDQQGLLPGSSSIYIYSTRRPVFGAFLFCLETNDHKEVQ